MAVDIGPKIGIEGEAQFRREIQQTNAALKTMAAEGKAVASAFTDEADAEKKVAAQKDVLNRQIEAQKKKLELLEKGLHDATQMYGPADEKTQKWAQAVYEATAKLNGMERELSDMDNAVEDTADNMEAAGDAALGWADVMKGQLLADAIKTGLSKMASLVKDASKAMWEASKAGAAYADDLLTMATTTGMSTKNLQEYKYMADLIDVSLDTLTGSMTKLTSNMSKAAKGNKDAVKTFENLGVAITDNNGQLRSTEDVFNDVVAALGEIENETERDATAMSIFGKSAKELNPLIEAGSDRLRELAEEANNTGYVLSGEALEALGKQQDAMDRWEKKVEAVSNQFAVGLAPGVEHFYSTLNDTMDDPRTQRALTVLTEGISNFVSGLGDIAATALPAIVDAFGIFDTRLATYSDDQLERLAAMESITSSWNGMKATFEEDAGAIWEEHEKSNALLGKLRDIVDEDGNVTEANQEMANYIVNELNKKLGLNIEMIDGVIKGWQGVQEEIENAIQAQTAQALMAAGAEQYAEALAHQREAGQMAAAVLQDLEAAEVELGKKQAEHQKNLEAIEAKYGDVAEAPLKVRMAYNEEGNAITELKGKVEALTEDYETHSKTVDDMMATTASYSKALEAQAKGDYQAVIDYTTKGYSLAEDYLANKIALDAQQMAELRDHYHEQAVYVDWYEEQIKQKKAGYNKEGLEAEKAHLAELKSTVQQKWREIRDEQLSANKAAGVSAAEAYGDGVISGLNNRQGIIYNTAAAIGRAIANGTRNALQIASPSKVGKWIGRMWDEGIISGMEESETALRNAASGLADTITSASMPSGYSADLMTTGYGYGTTSNAYTTNMGGITVRIDGAGAVNADELAQRVAVRLTDELRRAQRGGRA